MPHKGKILQILILCAVMACTFVACYGPFSPERQTEKSVQVATTARVTPEAPPEVKAEAPGVDLRFPGPVLEGAPRLKATGVSVDMTVYDYTYMKTWFAPQTWRSTGLYAGPGETIEIDVPEEGPIQGLYVQIGSHIDTLDPIPLSQRLRAPQLITEALLTPGKNTIKSDQGGLIYFKPTMPSPLKSLQVSVSGAVAAPYFVLGTTSDQAWQQMRQTAKAPMTELAGKNVILTVPTSYVLGLKNPEALLLAWDEFVDQTNWLAGYTDAPSEIGKSLNARPYDPWRFIADIQLSYGYLYAGYPIMLYAPETTRELLSVEGLQRIGWGFWHELGHNYQQQNWEVDSLVEVTNNIYALFLQEHYGNPSRLLEDNDGTGRSTFEDAKAYVTANRPDKNFHDDQQMTPFTRLVMFWQLREAYGWDFYQSLARAMRAREGAADQAALTTQRRMEAFVTESCRITGDNLLPFFEKWALIEPGTVTLDFKTKALDVNKLLKWAR